VQIMVTAVLLAFVLALLVTPLVRKWAFKCGALDCPDQRKIHKQVMPRLGGLAIFISFMVAVVLTREITLQTAGLLLGGALIVLLGYIDDTKGVSPWVKLGGQVVAACAVISFGLKVEFLTNPFSSGSIALGFLSIPVTILWIISITNAVNLIDGLDGLAGGTAGIASLTLAAVVWIEASRTGGTQGQWDSVVLALILAAAIIGFLRYNFFPARIFLGDSGSMYLGFSVATLAVMGLAKGATYVSIIIPVVILGIPILDTVFAIVRRYLGQKPIFQPDKEHLHHRLLQIGLSHRQAVISLYGVNIILGISAIAMTLIPPKQAMIFLLVLSTTILAVANKIGVTGARGKATYLPQVNKKKQRSSRM